MEQMDNNCRIDCDKNAIRNIIDEYLVSNSLTESTLANIIIVLNNVLSYSDPIFDISEINTLLHLIEFVGPPNIMIDVLTKELKSRLIREFSMNSIPTNQSSPNSFSNNESNASYTKRRKFIPDGNNFSLPAPGETGVIINKYTDPITKRNMIEKILIDSNGYEIEILDKYEEFEDDTLTNEAYTDLMSKVMEYNDLSEDIKSDNNIIESRQNINAEKENEDIANTEDEEDVVKNN